VCYEVGIESTFTLNIPELMLVSPDDASGIVRYISEVAKEHSPTAIVLNGLDQLYRDAVALACYKDLELEVFQLLKVKEPGFVVMAECRAPTYLPTSLHNRFHRRLYLPMPHAQARIEMCVSYLKLRDVSDLGYSFSTSLAQATKG